MRISDWSSDVCSSDLHAADILPCIYCYTCISAIFTSDPSRCAVNPETGFEYLGTPVQSSAKRIVVIGGGPAGMEAARRLDIKGHNVTPIEGSNQLGGTLRFASLAYEPNERLLRSEEHTSELQSLMRISYAVFCLKKKKTLSTKVPHNNHLVTT